MGSEMCIRDRTYTAPADGASMTDLVIDLAINADIWTEGPEVFALELSNPTTSTGIAVAVDAAAASVTTTINDLSTGNLAAWSITGPVAGDEGSSGQYTVSLNGLFGVSEVVSVDLALTDIATNSSDYGNLVAAINLAVAGNPDVAFDAVNGTLIYTSPADGSSMTDIVIDLSFTDDVLIEGPENFSLSLSNPATTTGAAVTVSSTGNSVTTTIVDVNQITGNPDGPAEWSLTGDVSVDEADLASYTLELAGSYGAGDQVSVELNLTDIDTRNLDYASLDSAIATASAVRTDISYDSATNTLTWTSAADGSTMTPFVFEVSIADDVLIEGPEDYQVALSNPTSATGITPSLSANDAVTTTINDTQSVGGPADGPAEWSVTGTSEVNEGDNASYTVALGGQYQAGEVVSVELKLTDNTTVAADYSNWIAAVQSAVSANADVSFDTATGVLTYAAPSDSASMTPLVISLATVADALIELREDFDVSLSNPASTTGVTTTVSAIDNTVTTIINGPPVAEDDINVTTVGVAVSGSVLDNDTDPDAELLMVTMVDGNPIGVPIMTANGLVVMAADGTYTYTPDPGFVGTDSFDYEVCDASGNCVTATVSIAVTDPENPGNTAPFAIDDNFTTFSDPASPQTLSAEVLGNDSDPDGDVLEVSVAGGVVPGASFTTINGGTVVVNTDGTFDYTPASGFIGVDTFDYTVTDPAGNTDDATVTILVYPDPDPLANDNPDANDDVATTLMNTTVGGNALLNDVDLNADIITAVFVDGTAVPVATSASVPTPNGGVFELFANGDYLYVPATDFIGTETVQYTISDGNSGSDTAIVYLTVFDQPPQLCPLYTSPSPRDRTRSRMPSSA